MKNKFGRNSKKKIFLEEIPVFSLEASDLIGRSKFNFSYYDGSQSPGVEFSALDEGFLRALLEKLKAFSRSPLSFWRQQRVGGGGLKVLEIYGGFPAKSDYKHPRHVPHNVQWGRFRLDNLTRLVGFVVPAALSNQLSVDRAYSFDCNTFYVVFIDLEHKFYKTEDR